VGTKHKKGDQKKIEQCSKCGRHYTRAMMMQVVLFTQKYKCIRCFNGGTVLTKALSKVA